MSASDWSELDGYEALVSELRANPPVAPERLRQHVLEGAPAARAPRSRKQKLALVVVPVAAVLAVGAALVHGFVNSGSRPSTAALPVFGAATVHGVNQTPPALAPTPEKRLATTAKSSQKEYSLAQSNTATLANADALQGALGRPAAEAVTIPRSRLVHATASLQVGVKRSELSAKTNEASQIVGSFGGYAQSVRYQASHQGYGEAFLALKVPVQNAQKAIAKLGGLGTLLSQSVSTQDLQAKVTHQTSAIGSLRRAIAVYEAALQNTTLPATQRAELQI